VADQQVVQLGANSYVLRGGLTETYLERQSPAYRLKGVQSSEDDPTINRFRHPSFPLGLGWQRMNRETGRGVGGMLDSTAWTALGPVTRGRLQETQSHANPADHFIKAVNFKGDLWGGFEEDIHMDGSFDLVCSRKYGATSDNWTGGGTIYSNDSSVGTRLFDMAIHKGSLFALYSPADSGDSELVYKVRSSTDGATWADAAGTGFPDNPLSNRYLTTTITRRNNSTLFDDMGRLLSFGNVLLSAIWRHPSSTDGATLADIQVLSSTDSGSNWASDVTIPSGDGPKFMQAWRDLDGASAPVMGTAEGIYSIDTSANTFELILELDGDPANGRWSIVGNDGNLYVGLGTGQVLRLRITTDAGLEVMTLTPGGDGLVTARQGKVTYMLNYQNYVLVAYGGHAANKNASIFAIDTSVIYTDPETGKEYMPWHHVWQDATGNLDIVAMAYSTEDDATPRLHFAVEGAAASINYHIEEPFTHPDQTSTAKHQATSILRLPLDGLGDPQTNSIITTAKVSARALTAGTGGAGASTDDFITLRYGLNGDADTTVTRGDFLSGQLSLPFGTSGSITAFANAGGGQVTVTSAAHGLSKDNVVTINGTTSYNGTFSIRNVTTNTFEITDTWVANDATGTWRHPIGIAGKTIGINLLLDGGSDNTVKTKLDEFELQAHNLLLDRKAWQFTVDIKETALSSSRPTQVADQDIHETIIANLKAEVESTTMSTFKAGEMTQARVRVTRPPVWNLDIIGSDDERRGYRTGFCTLIVEEASE